MISELSVEGSSVLEELSMIDGEVSSMGEDVEVSSGEEERPPEEQPIKRGLTKSRIRAVFPPREDNPSDMVIAESP